MQKLMSKEQIREFIKEKGLVTADDAIKALKDLLKDTIEEMAEAELETELGYKKSERAGLAEENRRNGQTSKKVRSELGEIELSMPRDRNGEFEPIVVRKNQKNITGIEEQILALYAKGVSTREIQDHLVNLYGIEVSPTLVSNVTNKILPMIKEWQNRPLQSVYAIVFLDAIHYKVRYEGLIQNKAAYMVIGVDLDGNKDVLGIWIGESESSKFWGSK